MSIYVFGYGALLNLKTIKELDKPKKFCPVIVQGLKRSLNVNGAKQLVLGVKDVKTAVCNGILLKVSTNELAKLQEREKLYTMKTLEKTRVDFAYGKCVALTSADQIICFYPQARYVLTKKEVPIKYKASAYMRKCLAGANAIGDDFFQDFLKTTTL
jgi:hypothetical protein